MRKTMQELMIIWNKFCFDYDMCDSEITAILSFENMYDKFCSIERFL